jgi:hypothetical protein
MSLDLGTDESSVKLDEVGERILGVMGSVNRNKIREVGMGDGYMYLPTTNEVKYFDMICYTRWRVIGFTLSWGEASTANEDPIIDLGHTGDADAFGKMTSAITGGEKFCVNDMIKYDPLNILGKEVLTEASATMDITWTEGVKFNVWQTSPKNLICAEAAVAVMSSGLVRPCMVIEVDTGGKW